MSSFAPGHARVLQPVFGATPPLQAHLSQIHAIINPATHLVNAIATLSGTATRGLILGMWMRGHITLAQYPALTVPQSAVLHDARGAYLFAVAADHRAQRIDVTTGLIQNGRIAVHGTGLHPGQTVVTVGNYEPDNGMSVHLTTGQPSAHDRSFVDWLQAHRHSVLFLMAPPVLGGIYSALRMPVSLFPVISFPRVVVYLDADDRPASQMELEVTRVVEQALRGVPKVTAISSTTSRGSADVDVRFNWGTDIPRAVLQVEAVLNQVLPHLPAGTSFKVQRMDPTKFPVLAYSLTSQRLGQVELRNIARYQLVPLLSSVPGVRRIGVMGGQIAEYRVTVDPVRLATLDLSMTDVEQALTAANIIARSGSLASARQAVPAALGHPLQGPS